MKKQNKLNQTAITTSLHHARTGCKEMVRLGRIESSIASSPQLVDPLAILKCAGKVLPLFVSCSCLTDVSLGDLHFAWTDADEVSLLVSGCGLVVAHTDESLLDDAQNMLDAVVLLGRHARLPASQFEQAAWLEAAKPIGLDWISRVLKLAAVLQRAGCSLTIEDQPAMFPPVDFQTTRVLPTSLQLQCRKVSINLDKQTGELDAQLPTGIHRAVPFKCGDPVLFAKLLRASGEFEIDCQPMIDLLSQDPLQLHSVDLISM
jgi:hypothetical protein